VDADKQQKDGSWPVPGDEGFVHPDGTPMSVTQLEENRQAQADRDHVGAVAHGAPLATPGPQADRITAEKVENAAKVKVDDPTQSWVEKSLDKAAADVDRASSSSAKK